MAAVIIPYHPRDYQARLHRELEAHRFSVIVMHRRAGKTVLTLNHLLKAALNAKKPLSMYGYIAPYRNQAKSIAWNLLKHFACVIPGILVNEGELSIQFPNTAVIRIFGADNPDALRGLRFDGVVLDEVADMRPAVWEEVVRPALSDRQGWAVFIGTPRGPNLFQDLYRRGQKCEPGWFGAMLRVDETNALPAAEVESLRREMSEAAFAQEYLCDFAASSDDVLIPVALVAEAVARRVKPSEVQGMPLIFGVDVARFGGDRSCVCIRRGLLLEPPIIYGSLDNMALADRIAALVSERKPDAVFVDAGQGAGVIDRLRQLGVDVVEVPFGASPLDPRFLNRRAEMWFSIRDWLRAGGALPPDCSALERELSSPTYGFNAAGRTLLEPKEKLKERLGSSPDIADALALTFAAPVFRADDAPTRPARAYSPTAWGGDD